MNKEELIDALDSVVWYNGLYNELLEVKEIILNNANNKNILRPEQFKDDQFEIFWMILVLLFGDYGTSPRSGWLEMGNKQELIKFIDDITKTAQDDNNE